MKCCHDPFLFDCSLMMVASMGGTDVSCSACRQTITINPEGYPIIDGQTRHYTPRAQGEQSAQLLTDEERKAVFDEFNPDPSYVAPEPPNEWFCGNFRDGAQVYHLVGEPCECTPK